MHALGRPSRPRGRGGRAPVGPPAPDARCVTSALGAVVVALFVAHDDDRELRARPVGRDRLGAPSRATIPSIDFIVRELRLPTAVTGARRSGSRSASPGSSSRSCSRTRSPRPTSSASRRARACSRSASIVLLRRRRAPAISVAALVGALVSCGADLRARLARRHLRLPLHPDRDRRLGVHALDRRLHGREGRHLRRARGDDLARRLGRPGRDRASCARCSSPSPSCCRSRSLLDRPLRALELGDDAADGARARASRSCRLALIAVVDRPRRVRDRGGRTDHVRRADRRARSRGACSARRRAASSRPRFVGAIIVLASDLVAEHVLPVALPTGVVTGAIGAPYLIWLLATANREGRGG